MNLEEVIETTDAAVFAKTGRHLQEVETIVLSGAWQSKTYEQMAETCKYSLTYLKQAAGPKLWKLLSEALGENVSKTNFRAVLERQWSRKAGEARGPLPPEGWRGEGGRGEHSRAEPPLSQSIHTEEQSAIQNLKSKISTPRQDWGEAPDVSIFYGRTQELATLEQWIVKDRCRLVAIVGMGGIGKTTLSVRCAKQMQNEFDFVVWRSLRNAPSIQELLTDLLQSLSNQQTTYLSLNIDDKVSRLIDYLHRHRCLLVLDNLETILRSSELAGHYREEHEGYRELLRRVVEAPHQSCLVLTSLEKPGEIAVLEGKTLPIRSLQLTGLQEEEAREILKEKNLFEAEKWGELIQLYRGNPLVLKIAASTIQELFGGRVSEFLKQNTIVFGDLSDILDEQFERLSALEQEILYWLVIACKPISLTKLRAYILSPVAQSELLEALESLLRRSLIERTASEFEALFTLQQPVVREYVTSQLIKQVCEEIHDAGKSQRIELLRNHALVKSQEKDEEVKKLQVRLILTPVKNRLYTIFRDERLIEEQLTKILSMLQGKSPLFIGYAKENIQNLLTELKSDVIGTSSRALEEHELLH